MNSKLPSSVAIIIVNSSHPSIEDVTTILRASIESGRRPFIACLSQRELELEQVNPQDFVRKFINDQLEKCRVTLEQRRQHENFNQLDVWKNEIEMRSNKKANSSKGIKDGIRNQSKAIKRDLTQNIIEDFPLAHETVELYLILFDVYDVGIIMSLIAIDSSMKAIVNLHPRITHDEEPSIKSSAFWSKLMREKFTSAFDDVAFLDLDVPVESRYMLERRSKLIYEQFCHLFYDIEDIKSSYKSFYERFSMVNVDVDDVRDDLNGLQMRLNRVPESMMSVDVIYGAIVDQISADNASHKSYSWKPFQVEVFERKFFDANDEWSEAFDKSENFYGEQIEKLKSTLTLWDGVEMVAVKKRQLLNYFMAKLFKLLTAKGAFDYLEFYVYALQFVAKTMSDRVEREFYENRSVGYQKDSSSDAVIKAAISDSHIDYENNSRIPEEIAQLVDDTIKLRTCMNPSQALIVDMFSPPAMIQHLTRLMEIYKHRTQQHSELMDVMLIKLHKRSIPKMFVTKSFSKILPTPLCFRDFNDYVRHQITDEMKLDAATEDDAPTSELKDEDFMLTSSIKHRQMNKHEDRVEIVSSSAVANKSELKAVEKDLVVFNVSKKRTQFHLTESEFNTVHLSAKALTFSWLNYRKILDFSCQLHGVLLSISHDLNANRLEHVTLTDKDEVKCSLEMDLDTAQRWRFSICLPNGITTRTLDDGAIEQYRIDEQSPHGGMKRVLFPNGFVMIANVDETKKVFSPNGAVFVSKPKSRKISMGFKKPQKDSLGRNYDEEATKLHWDSIASIHFLKDLADFSSYTMTIPSGEAFVVEHDAIVERLEAIRCEEMMNKGTGNVHITRDDGVKILYSIGFTKCQLPDGTLITTRFSDESIATAASQPDVPKSILDEIWSDEAKNESQFVVNHVLNHISDDYFRSVEPSHRIEHASFGSVDFSDGLKLELFNGTSLQAHSDRFLMTLSDGVTFQIDDKRLRLMDAVCNECGSMNEVLVYRLGESKVLAATRDTDGNTFEIKKNGRQVFYESDILCERNCSTCNEAKRAFELETFGERWVVLNRDYSGYEISALKGSCKAFAETSEEILHLRDPSQERKFHVDDSDINIVIERKTKPLSITRHTPKLSSPSSSGGSLMKSKGRRRKARKSMSKDVVIVQPPIEESTTSPWLTEDPSLPQDVSIEQRRLIQFHASPLSDFAESSAVGLQLKLNNKFQHVTDALLHLKKYSTEKFIFNVNGLTEKPVGKAEFEQNFKLVVRKTLEKHIQEVLECYRRRLADAIIDDLLDVAVKTEDKVESDMEITRSSVIPLKDDEAPSVPVAIKSFSFV